MRDFGRGEGGWRDPRHFHELGGDYPGLADLEEEETPDAEHEPLQADR